MIPSTSALRKRKFQQALEHVPSSLPERIAHVNALLGGGALRAACTLVRRWRLEAHFDVSVLASPPPPTPLFFPPPTPPPLTPPSPPPRPPPPHPLA